jgi:hypothetical protein
LCCTDALLGGVLCTDEDAVLPMEEELDVDECGTPELLKGLPANTEAEGSGGTEGAALRCGCGGLAGPSGS